MNRFDEVDGIYWTPLIPRTPEAAVRTLTPWIGANNEALARAKKKQLLKAWNALAYLFTCLNPDDGLHNRDAICHSPELPWGLPDSLREYYDESGWPVALVGILDEMWSRFEKGEIDDEEFYCFNAVKAGIVKGWALAALG